MNDFLLHVFHALLMSLGMFWCTGWGMVIGILISAVLQVFVPKEKMTAFLGGNSFKEIIIATAFGAASSSCSFASAAIMRTLIQKGAGFITALAFLFSSTNLVIELGIILYLLMGWQFMVAEWVGGLVLVAIMSLLVRLTYPKQLIEEARKKVGFSAVIPEHSQAIIPSGGFLTRLKRSETQIAIAQSFVMDWSMLWKNLVFGFLIAGFLSEFVPNSFWQTLFVTNWPPLLQVPLNAMTGPLIAVVSFLCSDGNVPMAAVLWGSGISFAGVLAFLYADLIVLPLIDVYRRYFGWKMAAYITAIFYVTMVLTGIIMDIAFTSLHLVPTPNPNIRVDMMHFEFNYTFWLNLGFGLVSGYLCWLFAKNPVKLPDKCCDHD